MAHLFTHIKLLVNIREGIEVPLRGAAMGHLPCLENAWLLEQDGNIHSYGKMQEVNLPDFPGLQVTNCSGRILMPAWCDSHTHLVFGGSREDEFVAKIKGETYASIAAKGGGILSSARHIGKISEEELFDLSWMRLQELMRLGTGAIEIKSGYGLSLAGELKMLRVIQKLKDAAPIPVKATFLGAHALPEDFKDNKDAYIDLIIQQMMPQIGSEGLADFIDVFCEQGFFTQAETELICREGQKWGLKPKIHANQLSLSGGVEAAVSVGALSADHLETIDEEAISLLAKSNTIGTVLPTAAFFLRMQYPPVKRMLEAGCALALASDFNPGSSPSGNMNLVVAMACIQLKMTPEEAFNAATLNGAFAMELNNVVGSITLNKQANLILTKPVPSLAFLPYQFGTNHIHQVYIKGIAV